MSNLGLINIIQAAIEEYLANTHTATIGKVVKVNKNTIDVKPVFKWIIEDKEIELPVFKDVPVFTLQGGNNYRIMPINVGDYALLIIAERCIDDWWIGEDNKRPREYRMHDYSDAIAIVGLNNLKNAINIPTGYEEVKGDIVHTGNLTQTGDYNLTGNIIQTGDKNQQGNYTLQGDIIITGNVIIQGNLTLSNGSANINGIDFNNHTHPYTDDGNPMTTGVAQ